MAAVKAGETATVTFTFSEAPSGFVAGDITTTGGALTGLAVTGDPKVYTATFTPTPGTAAANASITVAASSYTDTAGNNGAAGSTPAIAIDTLAPTLTITDLTPGTATGPVVYGFNFSEPVTGFTADDVVTAGVKAQLIQTDATHYTMTVIPPTGSGTMQVGVNAGAVTDLAGNPNTFALSDPQAYAPAPAVGPYVPGQASIDLGIYGKLIAPVQVEGNWYYFWDRSSDGTIYDVGSFNGGVDYTTHNVLDGLFNHDINGVTNTTVANYDGGYGTTDTYRYGTLNSVSLALPTLGGQSSPPYGANGIGNRQPGTTVSSGATTNDTYNDLLAIWDAYNGSGTGTGLQGTPAGWLSQHYWSATPAPLGHAVFTPEFGATNGSSPDSTTFYYVALQVLSPDTTAPTFTSPASATLAENTPTSTTAYDATADGDVGVTYTLTGADAALFNIAAATGLVTFKAIPNFEAPADAGANNVYDFTVTATDAAHNATDKAVQLTVTDVAEGAYTPGQAVIPLGNYGNLIAPVQVEGNWYYYWDRSGDGTSADTGSLHGGSDHNSHGELDNIFNRDSNGVTNDGYGTTDSYRYATINNVSLALPTSNGGVAYPQGISAFQSGTAVSLNTTTNNPTFNDLLAVWDAYNGSGTGSVSNGTPGGWKVEGYWSATPSTSGHASVMLGTGYIYNGTDFFADYGYVALQVLAPDTIAPTFTSLASATLAENTPTSTTAYAATTASDFGVTYTLTGADAALFNIAVATGLVTFKASPNFEAPADAGANNIYDFTVTATDASSNATAKAVQLTVTDVAEGAYTLGQAVIPLGTAGNLIKPVQVEGKWYYFWDRSGDGTSAGVDYTTHDVLDLTFKYAGDFTTINPTYAVGNAAADDTTDTYRFATINGVNLALPTANGGVAYPQGINAYQNGTSYTDAGLTTNGTTSSFNDLLAVWDAYNGSGTGTGINGTPAGWQASLYWSATPSASGHAVVGLSNGSVYDGIDYNTVYVALQVL